jgi:hypothetical protein
LSENVAYERLGEVQKSILCLLSWVPSLNGRLLLATLGKIQITDETEIIEAIQDLVLSCIVQAAGDKYAITGPVRHLFRRKHGFGETRLLEAFGTVLDEEWTRAEGGDGHMTSELIDSFVYMHALEGKSLPDPLRRLLPPAVLLDLVRDIYNRARDERELYDRVRVWGEIASDMRCDESIREEILGFVIRANARLGERKAVDDLLTTFEKRGYRSRHFLKGFALRLRGQAEAALPHFRESIKVRKFFRSSVHELALCLQRANRGAELQALLDTYHDLVQNSAFLLDFLVGSLLGQARFEEAEAAINKLRYLPDEDGRAGRREAQLLMRQTRDFAGAVRILDELIDKGLGVKSFHRATRAIAAA